MTSSAVTSRNMVNIGSASCGNKQRYWNQWTYFTASEEVIQNALAVQYAVTVLRHRRICVYSGLEDEYGWNGYNMQVNYLNKVGYVQNTDYYVYTWSQGYAAYQKLNIQSLMLFDYNGDFVQQLIRDTSGAQASVAVYCGSYWGGRLLDFYYRGYGLTYKSQRFFLTASNGLAKDSALNYIQLFNTQYTGAAITVENALQQVYSVAGWIAGTMAVKAYEALRDSGKDCTATNLQRLLLGPGAVREWTVGTDFLIGGFSGECGLSTADDPNSGCNCNQGDRTAYIYEVGLTSAAPHFNSINPAAGNSTLTLPQTLCYMQKQSLPIPLLVALLESSVSGFDIPNLGNYAQRLATQMGTVRNQANETVYFDVSVVTADDSGSYLTDAAADQKIQTVMGVAPSTLQVDNFFLVGVVRPTVAGNWGYTADAIHVTPTMPQTLYYSLALPIQHAAPEGEAYHYCVPVTTAMPNVNGLSTTVAASEAFWNCPASFSVARGGGSGGAAEDVEEGAALPPEPVRRRRVPRVTMPLTSCGTTRLCITDGDGVGTSFPRRPPRGWLPTPGAPCCCPSRTSPCTTRRCPAPFPARRRTCGTGC
eukprot:gene1755-biopygen1317